MNEEQLRERLRECITRSGTPYRWSADNGVNRSIVHKVLQGKVAPTPQLVAALGLKRVVSYEAIGEN